MRILVDILAISSNPDICSPAIAEANSVEFLVFDRHLPPDEVARILTTFRPDVVLVDAAWMSISALLEIITTIKNVDIGHSTLRNDRLWSTVMWPMGVGDIASAPSDCVDTDILELVSMGLSDKEIASATYVSHQSVRNRISRMHKRAKIPTRAQMAWMHRNHSLIQTMLPIHTPQPQESI